MDSHVPCFRRGHCETNEKIYSKIGERDPAYRRWRGTSPRILSHPHVFAEARKGQLHTAQEIQTDRPSQYIRKENWSDNRQLDRVHRRQLPVPYTPRDRWLEVCIKRTRYTPTSPVDPPGMIPRQGDIPTIARRKGSV